MRKIPAVKLTIHFGAALEYAHHALSKSLMGVLREYDLAGATMIYGTMGYGHSRRIYSLMNEVAMTNLPVTIEVVDEREKIERAIPRLIEILAGRGLIQVQQTVIVRRPIKLEGAQEGSEA